MENPKVIKSIIRATIISNPLKTTVRQLQYDFKKYEGYEVPYRQMGFSDFTQYLCSIPDTVQVIGTGPHAEVRVVLDQKSAHVAELVSRQRTPPKKRSLSTRFYKQRQERARYICNPNPPRFQNKNENSIPVDSVNTTNEQPNKSKSDEILKIQHGGGVLAGCNVSVSGNTNSNLQINKESNAACTEKHYNELKPIVNNKVITNEGKSEFQEISELRRGGTSTKWKERREKILSPVPTENVNYKVPYTVQENLSQLIKQFPDGLWCSKLPGEYKTRFRTNFNYTDYGYKSLIHLCCELPTIFKFEKPGMGDYVLFHVDTTNTNRKFLNRQKETRVTAAEEMQHKTKPAIPDNVADILKSTLALAPSHIVGLDAFIPRQEVISKVGDYIDIQIAEVYDPSKFWFSLYKNIEKLDALMDEMQLFYRENCKSYEVPSCLLQDGLYCTAIYMQEYHRAVITNMLPHSKTSVKVFFLDYGTVSIVPMDGLFYLHENFSDLPAQAIRGRLAKVHPPQQHEMWSLESSQYFLDLIRNKVFIAQIHALEEDVETFDLIVADTSGDNDVFINDSLVTAGYARFDHQGWKDVFSYGKYAPCVESIHLYPTFDEIEKALVPSLSELLVISAASVSLDRIFPQYFKEKQDDDVSISNEEEPESKYTYFTSENGKLTPHHMNINYHLSNESPPVSPENPLSFIVYNDQKPKTPCASPMQSLSTYTTSDSYLQTPSSESPLSPNYSISNSPSPQIYQSPEPTTPFMPFQYPTYPINYACQHPQMWNIMPRTPPPQHNWNTFIQYKPYYPTNGIPMQQVIPIFKQMSLLMPNNKVTEVPGNIFEKSNMQRRSKSVIKTQIFGLNLHVILYNEEPHLMISEVHKHYPNAGSLMLVKRALCMSVNIIDVNLKNHTDLLNELLRYNVIDGSVSIIDLIPLTNLADVTKLLGNETIITESFESVLHLYNRDSLVWQQPL